MTLSESYDGAASPLKALVGVLPDPSGDEHIEDEEDNEPDREQQ